MRNQQKKSFFKNQFKKKNTLHHPNFVYFMEQLLHNNKILCLIIYHPKITKIINFIIFILFLFFIFHNWGYDELSLFKFLPLSLKQIILKSMNFIFFCSIFACAIYLISFKCLQYTSIYFYAYYMIWLLNYFYEIKNILILLLFSIQTLYLNIQVILVWLTMTHFWLTWFICVEIWPVIQEVLHTFLQ
jgi:hypothetical protein